MLEAPDLAVELLRTEGPSRPQGEELEELEFTGSQGHPEALPLKEARLAIEEEVAEGEGGAHGRAADGASRADAARKTASGAARRAAVVGLAAEEGHGAGHEDPRREGLGDEVVGPEAEAEDLVLVGFPCREDDHGGKARRAEASEELEAVSAGKAQVEEDQGGSFLGAGGEALLGRADEAGLSPFPLEVGLDEEAYLAVILDDQDGKPPEGRHPARFFIHRPSIGAKAGGLQRPGLNDR